MRVLISINVEEEESPTTSPKETVQNHSQTSKSEPNIPITDQPAPHTSPEPPPINLEDVTLGAFPIKVLYLGETEPIKFPSVFFQNPSTSDSTGSQDEQPKRINLDPSTNSESSPNNPHIPSKDQSTSPPQSEPPTNYPWLVNPPLLFYCYPLSINSTNSLFLIIGVETSIEKTSLTNPNFTNEPDMASKVANKETTETVYRNIGGTPLSTTNELPISTNTEQPHVSTIEQIPIVEPTTQPIVIPTSTKVSIPIASIPQRLHQFNPEVQ
ncbi:proteoglycan 4-like [Camellia sinensis]|uniref:proteoglycan 4-like n=1 Tax=Camellia sinensis TaxID=4442 RepID=UPI001035A555|nr:proteoglycan 4-like [Camellia sinensis]